MTIKIKRFDTTLPLPEYKTQGAAGLDLTARENVTVPAKAIARIPLNIAVEVPPGYWSLVAPRSSTHKLGLSSANAIGIIDSDYCGDNDEYQFLAYNFTDNPVTVEKGTRIAQMVILPAPQVTIEEAEHLGNADRGGFGTTGQK